MKHWWLNFGAKARLGCTLIECPTESIDDAVWLAWEYMCNPGDEVEGWIMPNDLVEKCKSNSVPFNVLISRENIIKYGLCRELSVRK